MDIEDHQLVVIMYSPRGWGWTVNEFEEQDDLVFPRGWGWTVAWTTIPKIRGIPHAGGDGPIEDVAIEGGASYSPWWGLTGYKTSSSYCKSLFPTRWGWAVRNWTRCFSLELSQAIGDSAKSLLDYIFI